MRSAELRRVDNYQPGTLPVFVQGSNRPIFHGGGSETWSCGECSTVLLRDIHVDAFWDVAFRCFTCRSVWLSPSRPAGKPVPQAGIFVPNGEYLIKSETIPLGEAGFFGPGAHESREHEIGKRPSGSRVADEAFLRKLADRGEALLASKFGKLHQSYLRGRQSKTPPKDAPHRLVDLIFKVRSAVGSTTGTPGVYLHELIELSAAVEMCERWSKDPELPKIINGLKNATDFPHALIVLSMASLLADHGNAVELVPAEQGKRTPDLRLHLNRRRRMNVEVKVPQGLIGPRNPLTVDEARGIVAGALSEAGTGQGDQLGPEHDGMLIVGSLHLTAADLDSLADAAKGVAAGYREKRQHVFGVVVVMLRDDEFAAAIEHRIVPNPHYTGTWTLEYRAELQRT